MGIGIDGGEDILVSDCKQGGFSDDFSLVLSRAKTHIFAHFADFAQEFNT